MAASSYDGLPNESGQRKLPMIERQGAQAGVRSRSRRNNRHHRSKSVASLLLLNAPRVLTQETDNGNSTAVAIIARRKLPDEEVTAITDSASLRDAVRAWCDDKASALAKYGDISTWDTSGVGDMAQLFKRRAWGGECSSGLHFNDDIARWKTSAVTKMGNMFEGCSAFNRDVRSFIYLRHAKGRF